MNWWHTAFGLAIVALVCVSAVDLDEDDDDDNFEDNPEVEMSYVSASSDDLARLFVREAQLIRGLRREKAGALRQEVIRLLASLDLSHRETDDDSLDFALNHVAHPVNAFHLVKRTALLWPNVYPDLHPDLQSRIKPILSTFPNLKDFQYGAAFGLVSIQNYYNLSVLDLARGNLTFQGQTYLSQFRLSADDCQLMADVAKEVLRLDKMVSWTEAGLEVAQHLDQASPLILKKWRKKVEEAKSLHDEALVTLGLGAVLQANGKHQFKVPDGLPEAPLFTEQAPFDPDLADEPVYVKSLKRAKNDRAKAKQFSDLESWDVNSKRLLVVPSFHRAWHTLQPISKRLCNRDTSLRPPAMDKDLRCVFLHYHDPYLRLGPFRYEPLNADPHVAVLRSFYSAAESHILVAQSRGHLHSTPFQTATGRRFYTTQRGSKRQHLDEEDHVILDKSSQRISLATRWLVDQEDTASENYHMINYGIGGQIEVHLDYWGPGKFSHPGGPRLVTFLGYLHPAEHGGNTVFPELSLAVKPQLGDALFWLTAKGNERYDTRMYHFGCPVLYGHKWVLTKWLYSYDQMWRHPCSSSEESANFPMFSNTQHRDQI